MKDAPLVVIPTLADFSPERAASLDRLRNELADASGGHSVHLVELRDREPSWSWWARASQEARERGKDLLLLQDDVELCPNFFDVLDAMVENTGATPVLGLFSNHPGARKLFVEGPVRWYSTADGLVGPAHYWPIAALEAYDEWIRDALVPRAVEMVNEDDLAGLFCAATNRPLLHPVVSPIDHDLSVSSTYGNDNHRNRRPGVTWRDVEWSGRSEDLRDPNTWKTTTARFGRYYRNGYLRLRQIMRDKEEASKAIARLEHDVCPPNYARWFSYG